MRSFGLQIIKLISLVRYYKFSEGIKIFFNLLSGSGNFFTVNSKVFNNKIYLRKSQSDPFIFDQIFCEQQYNFAHPDPEKVRWIVDAGANIGLAAIYFSQKFPNAKIISIEPDKGNFDLLKKNTSNYKNVHPVHAAVWYKNEDLVISNEEEKSAGYMMKSGNGVLTNTVKAVTIPQIMQDYNIDEIGILKIDIEGSEKELFEFESSRWLVKCKCIITELHDWLKPGTSKVFFREMSNFDWTTYVKGENIICLR